MRGELGRELFSLVEDGDASSVERFLKQNASEREAFINWANNDFSQCGETALMHASRRGNLPVIRLLLAAGADINQCDWHFSTALHKAKQSRQQEAVDLLLQHGAKDSLPTRPAAPTLVQKEWVDVSLPSPKPQGSAKLPATISPGANSVSSKRTKGPRQTRTSMLRAAQHAAEATATATAAQQQEDGPNDCAVQSGGDSPNSQELSAACPTILPATTSIATSDAEPADANSSGLDPRPPSPAEDSNPPQAVPYAHPTTVAVAVAIEEEREESPLSFSPSATTSFAQSPSHSSPSAPVSVVDPRFLASPACLEERQEIRSHRALSTYYTHLRRGLHEALTASSVLASDIFAMNPSSSAQVLDGLAGFIGTPVVSTVLSFAAVAVDALTSQRIMTAYQHVRELNPSGDPVQESWFVECLARRMTLSHRSEIALLINPSTAEETEGGGVRDVASLCRLLIGLVQGQAASDKRGSPRQLAERHGQQLLQYVFAGSLKASTDCPEEVAKELVDWIVEQNRGTRGKESPDAGPSPVKPSLSLPPIPPPKPPRRIPPSMVTVDIAEVEEKGTSTFSDRIGDCPARMEDVDSREDGLHGDPDGWTDVPLGEEEKDWPEGAVVEQSATTACCVVC